MRGKRKVNLPVIELLGLVLAVSLLKAGGVDEKKLPEKYRRWLEVVAYIITPEEKEVFLKLKSDRDRDIFIKAFWKHRDPTPGTERNEYKEEIYRRFRYVNKYFGRGSGKPGWKTDRGRVYMILGPPDSIDRIDSSNAIYPVEIWYYHGDPRYGLPPYFGLIFYKKGGVGDYKLYSPTTDGPESLLVDNLTVDVLDFREIYRRLAEVDTNLADLSISLVPGERTYNFQPSLESSIILSNLFEYPKKLVDTRYAKDFLKYKGIVEVEYSVNYIGNRHYLHLSRSPLAGCFMLSYAVLPERISVGKYGSSYYVSFEVSGSLQDSRGRKFFSFTKKFSRYLSRKEVALLNVKGLVLSDAIPVVEGEHTLLLLVKNPVSKEFTYFEAKVKVPTSSAFPVLMQPLLAYRVKEMRGAAIRPFASGKFRLVPTVRKVFKRGDKAYLYLEVENLGRKTGCSLERRLFLEEKLVDSKKISLSERVRGGKAVYLEEIGSLLRQAGEYTLEVVLLDDMGSPLATTAESFVVTPLIEVARPVWLSASIPPSKFFGLYFSLARQYASLGMPEKALKWLDKALTSNPAFQEAVYLKASLLIDLKRYSEALKLLESFRPTSKQEHYFYLKGRALEGLGELLAAVESYRESLKHYDSDIKVLNSLGRCYLKLGRLKEAEEAFRASLLVEPRQDGIRKLLKKIEASYEKK